MAVMKKSVKSRSALKQLALESGASIKDGSAQFNAGKQKVVPKKRLEPRNEPEVKAPGPEPIPEPVADKGSELVAQSLDQMSKATTMMMAQLKSEIAAIKLQAAEPPIGWDFDFIRDTKTGYLEKVSAIAIFPDKRSLN